VTSISGVTILAEVVFSVNIVRQNYMECFFNNINIFFD